MVVDVQARWNYPVSMGMFFFNYSGAKGRIVSLAGTKGIVIPRDEFSDEMREILDRLSSEEGAQVKGRYVDMLQGRMPEVFAEEHDHFQCLVQSRFALIFDLLNVLSRMSFSIVNNNISSRAESDRRRIVSCNARIMRCMVLYDAFHMIAFPFVEAHADVALGHSGDDVVIYSDKYSCAVDEIKRAGGAPCHGFVGGVVDDLFMSYLSDEYLKGCCLRGKVKQIWALSVVAATVLFLPRAIDCLVRLFRRHYRVLVSYGLDRLKIWLGVAGKGDGKRRVLPSILSGGGFQVDPAAFYENKKLLGSQEDKYRTPVDDLQARLLWHVMRRVSAVYYLRKYCKMGLFDVLYYLSLLKDFSGRWLPRPSALLPLVSEWDKMIVHKAFNSYFSAIMDESSLNNVSSSLAECAVSVWLEIRDVCDLGDGQVNAELYPVLHQSYMHI